MSKIKSNFLVFRSYIPWVILGLVIIMWVAGSTQKSNVLANPAAQGAFATFVFDLSDGLLVGSDGPNPTPGGPGDPPRKIIGVLFHTQNSPGCITLIQYGVPIQICD